MATPAITKHVGEYIINADIDSALGETYNCIVFEGQHATSEVDVAAKRIKWLKGVDTDMIDTEAELMKNLPKHDNVLKLLDYVKTEAGEYQHLWLMLEKCEFGDLEKFAQNTGLGLEQKLDIFLQCAKGLNHIHENQLVHRDIKLKNILVQGPSDCPVIKVGDFGVSRIIEKDLTKMTTLGTDAYKAPELHEKGKPKAGQAVDTFSLGVSFLTILEHTGTSAITTFKVDDVPLGEYLHQHPDTDVMALISKPNDSTDVRRVKRLVAAMLAPTAAARPIMQEVVDELSEIHASLCMKCLLISVNTAWKSPNVCLDKGTLEFKVRKGGKKTKQEPKGATATPYVSATNMECVNELTARKIKALLAESVDGEKEGVLVAVDTQRTNAVWILTPRGWEKTCDVPADCQMLYVCICEIPDGFVLLGGRNRKGKTTSQCWLYSFSRNQWKRLQNMSIARWLVSAAVVGNLIVAAGGWDSADRKLDVCEKMALSSGVWSSASPMPHAMSAPLIATVCGHVYIKDKYSRNFIFYCPDTDSHTELVVPDIVPEDIGASMISHESKMYLLGGEENLAVQYDPHTQQWIQLTPPSAKYTYYAGCCAISMHGKILLCGGSNKQCERATMEEYDFETNSWKLLDTRLPFQFDWPCCKVIKYSK